MANGGEEKEEEERVKNSRGERVKGSAPLEER